MTPFARTLLRLTGLAAVVAAASPAAAHHVMDGHLPSTFLEGLLSGLGHPVIGPDHLAFVVALGIAAAVVPGPLAVIAIFIALSAAGVMMHMAELNLPLVEPLLALTVLLAGATLVWSHAVTRPLWLALAAAAGLLHGYAFGESIVGAERTVLGAYLLGIALVTGLIATAAMLVAKRVLAPNGVLSPRLRGAGVLLGCIGTVLLAATLVSG